MNPTLDDYVAAYRLARRALHDATNNHNSIQSRILNPQDTPQIEWITDYRKANQRLQEAGRKFLAVEKELRSALTDSADIRAVLNI